MFRWTVWLLFFLSGACGLVYEVLWSKQLGLIFGNTVHSLAVVLAAFMGGLALGSYLAGRFLARRPRLLMLYGALELFIGLYCLALPGLFRLAEPVYASLYGTAGSAALPWVRFAIASFLLLIPTTCMGATLPVLTQFLVRSSESFSRTAGTLYAVNTFGAVLGAAGAGFVLLPSHGVSGANLTAVCGNLGLGFLALAVGWRQRTAGRESPATPVPGAEEDARRGAVQPGPGLVRAAAAAFAVTGFAGMATQIGWTRALSLSLGSSTYAFSLIVAVFILGLGLGGAAGARAAPRLTDPLRALALVLLCIGLSSVVVAMLLGVAPVFFFWIIAWGSQWRYGTLLALEALGVALLLLPPTVLMGATLPLTLQVARRRADSVGGAGRTIGTLYALNTLGAILGSLLGGLLLLPLLQIRNTLLASALLYALPGAVLLVLAARAGSSSVRTWRLPASLALLTLGAVGVAPAWDPAWISSGAYLLRGREAVQAARHGRFGAAMPINAQREILFHREGVSGTVTVFRHGADLTLSVGGKPDASSGDMSTQAGLALIPNLLHRTGPREVLVIGMGSGITVGAALADPAVRRVDVVEISRDVVAASAFFAEHSGLAYAPGRAGVPGHLADSRVELLINDGRNHLAYTSRQYDVIISEPSNPWIAGIGNLFTEEAFAAARARLRPGGVFCQWLHRYGMGRAEFLSVMKTYAAVFPHVQLWDVLPGSDYLLLGSDQPLMLDMQTLDFRMTRPALHDWLVRGGFATPAELLASLIVSDEAFRAVCAGAAIHTDDNLLLEFSAPRTLYRNAPDFRPDAWRVSPLSSMTWAGVQDDRRQETIRHLDISLAARWCLERQRELVSPAIERELVSAALRLVPDQHWARMELPRLAPAAASPAAPTWFLLPERNTVREPVPAGPAVAAELQECRAAACLMRGELPAARAALEAARGAQPGRWQTLVLEARERAHAEAYTESRELLGQAAKAGAPELTRVAEALYDTLAANEYDDYVDRDLAALLGSDQARQRPERAEFWGWSALLASINRGGPEPEVFRQAELCLRLGGRIPPIRVTVLRRFQGVADADTLAFLREHLMRYRTIAPGSSAVYADLAVVERAGAAAETIPEKRRERLAQARQMAHGWAALAPDDPAPQRLLADIWQELAEPAFAAAAARRAVALGAQ